MRWWHNRHDDPATEHEIDEGPSRSFDQIKMRLDLAILENEKQQARLRELIRTTKEARE